MATAGRTVTGTVGQDGRWQVRLPVVPLQHEPIEIQVRTSSNSTLTVRNVLVGDVWLCTGPSNIYWPVRKCDNAPIEIAEATYPQIRFFTVEKNLADRPQDDCNGNWLTCSPRTVADVSGIGFFFGRQLHQQLDVPIGILQSCWGGSRIEAWTSEEALENQPALKPILQSWDTDFANYDDERTTAAYEQELVRWKRSVVASENEGKKAPPRPKKPENPRASQHRPACLFNGMITPLIPFRIRGVISYQGLGNLYWAEHSRVLLPTMIRDWQSRWGQGAFAFGMVQPAPFLCDRWPKQQNDAYALQREAQMLVLDQIPRTGVAATMDIGDLDELHFTNKQAVAQRLANWALATEYQENVKYTGPIYESMSIENNRIRIRFSHAAEGLGTSDGLAPTHFTIAGSDRKFHPAVAVIDGKTVWVQADQVAQPVAVRFAWSDTAIPNLVNSDGLPASIFRTDVPPLHIQHN
ncbi:MAG: sialate O-acetylesterase [Fuerstiella sp.]|nr:sialate O-acetylesterase [Fuerstiella sp.]